MLMKLNYHNLFIETIISALDKHASKKQNVSANNSNFMTNDLRKKII